MRIQNASLLMSHGDLQARKALLEILEAGLEASDPYHNTRRLVRREGDRLIIGCRDFEPEGDPSAGDEVIGLETVGRIYVVGAGKGIQRVAKALEDILGDRLTGGHVIDKKGQPLCCERIGVTFGGHPVPDMDCVRGCQRIVEIIDQLQPDDLIFTLVANGVSSLLTLPVPEVTLEDVREVTYLMQIKRGAFTGHLNPVRNHLDQLKGGKIARRIGRVKAIHILAWPPFTYQVLMTQNIWLHTLPGCSTFETAIEMLKRYDAWDEAPEAVRAFLLKADPAQETVKADEYETFNYRIFGVMPYHMSGLSAAQAKAQELGFKAHMLARLMHAEAREAGRVMAWIARNIEQYGEPFEPPCVLLSGGELLVTVGDEKGIGGRNQEFVLSAALDIAGSENILVGSVDTDGTDGPGTQFWRGDELLPCLAGGIADGSTVARAEELGIDLFDVLKRHDTTPALWKLGDGIVAQHNISLNDIRVVMVLGRGGDH